MSLIIKGPAYVAGKVQPAAVRIEGGMIQSVTEKEAGTAAQIIELGPRQLVLPAGIDLLCGLRDWIAAPKETVECATRGALAGGVTVVCDQANIVPRLNTVPRIRERVEFVGERAYTDVGVAAAPPLDPQDIAGYRDAGAYCVGLYSWNLRQWRYARDLDDSTAEFQRYADAGLHGSIVVDEAAFQDTPLHEVGEQYALTALLRRLPTGFRARIQITQPESVDKIQAERDRLPNVSVQAPHHAVSIDSAAAHETIGVAARHVPPLRSAEEVEQMKRYLADGRIDIVTSWHAPHRMQDKFSSKPIPGELTPKAGYSAIDLAYPHLLTMHGIETTCRHFCETPARYLGLKKGLIEPGYEADLVIFEEDEGLPEQNLAVSGSFTGGVWKVEPMEFHSMGKVTPFCGDRLRYRVLKTFLRGEVAFDRETATHTRREVRCIGS